MIENWIFLAILAGIFSNINNFLNRYILLKDNDPSAYAWFYETFRTLLFILVLPFGFYLDLSVKTISMLLLLGFIEVISIYFWMKMSAYTHLSVSSIISRTRIIWVPIFALIFLQEQLKTSEYVGIVILFLGVSITVAPHKIMLDKGIKYSYASSLIVSGLSIILKEAATRASTPVLTCFMSIPSVLFIPLLMKNAKKRILESLKIRLSSKIMAGVASAINIYFLILALRMGPVGTVNAVYQGTLIFSVLAGIFIFKEKEDVWKKIIGASVTVLGIFLVTT